ncbi:site-specific integrase [Anaerosalibacter bizertensis]|uniref:Site-specific integrase n=1 Tax=Anaerosalibacter bizertensis TaxID=932217 RepID=A0A844FIA1_9FIRM|nr:site-specific integrase [Anaerosalibacter bizertensis]MSS43658.1 site-specific integrase [Anaerosalibacter bizertensis]
MQGGVRKRGKRWYYYFDVGTIGGKRKKIERVGGDTKAEALKALRKAITKYEYGYVEPENMTVEKYFVDWLENFIKANRKINTYNRYKSIINNSITPNIGGIKLSNLKPIHIENLLLEEKKKGLSGSTLQNIYVVMNSALNRAVKLQILYNNPCQHVERPKREKFVASTLTIDEFHQILNSLNEDKYNDYIFSFILKIVLETGLRRGELAGLEWENIDLDNNILTIKNNLVYSHGKVYLDTPKTEEGERTLYFSDTIKQLFKKHKEIQDKNKEKYGQYYIKNIFNNRECDFIITWENGKYLHPSYYTKRFNRILKKLDLNEKVRFHDLRHTNASFLLSLGVDFKTIQERLGHSDINTTLNIYSHVSMEMQKEAVNKLNKTLLGGKSVAK